MVVADLPRIEPSVTLRQGLAEIPRKPWHPSFAASGAGKRAGEYGWGGYKLRTNQGRWGRETAKRACGRLRCAVAVVAAAVACCCSLLACLCCSCLQVQERYEKRWLLVPRTRNSLRSSLINARICPSVAHMREHWVNDLSLVSVFCYAWLRATADPPFVDSIPLLGTLCPTPDRQSPSSTRFKDFLPQWRDEPLLAV
jgi:hypothetical protein